MSICFLCYEFPPGTGNGIGSYTFQVARALTQAGHEITVIAGAGKDLIDEPAKRILVVRLPWEREGRFFYEMGSIYRNLRRVAETCRRFHKERPFDLIEAPDYRAEAYYLLREGIDCPLVTKLHTPSYPIWDMEAKALQKPFLRRLLARWLMLAPRDRLEHLVIQKATRLQAPSRAVGALVEQYYGLNPDHIDVVPYPYSPSPPGNPDPHRATSVVLYVGRLEVRKGVHLFAHIIPQVRRRFPQARFWFLGQDSYYQNNLTMRACLYAQFTVSKTVSAKKSHVGLTFIRESAIWNKSFTERAPKLGRLIEFYRSPARVQWTPTGNNVPDYPKLAQLWWQNIGDASSGAKTPQAAMDALAAAQDSVMERLEKSGVQGACGPKLNKKETAEYWYKKAEKDGTIAPQRKLANEKPKGETIDYDTLIKSWPASPPKRAEAK